MFRRKDEDVAQDLLGDTDTGMNTTNTAQHGEEPAKNETAAPAASAPANNAATAPAGTPSYSRTEQPVRAPANAGAGYRQPVDYGRSRMQDFRGAPATAASGPEKSPTSKSGSRRVLTVGNDILLKGEIATCDRLVIEGEVDATLNEVHTVEIAETGSFKGSAQIEDAEISGLFEGELVVRNRLVIYSTGQVRGKITYGEIEIERGGELTGEIKAVSSQAGKGKNAKSQQKQEAA